MNVNPETKMALIMYPSIFRKPTKEVIVYSIADAKGKWEIETRKFIHDTLRMWVISRAVSYVTAGKLSDERNNAVSKLMLMFSFNQSEPLDVLCRRIVQDGQHFIRIFPNKASRHYPYFKEVISQILMWCDEYQKNHEQILANLVSFEN